jgi:hypothetical protein
MKSRAAEYAGFVEHPRYGKGPRFTGMDVADSPDGRVYCHWHSPPGIRIPNTAVVADVSRQRRATLHVTHYFDARRVCRKCGMPFLFFAEEQKHWYEDLLFPLEADCLDCAPCRKDEQRVRAIREKYEALLHKTPRVEADTLELVESGLFLVESAVFSGKLLPKLRGILRPLLLDVEGPHYSRAQELLSMIGEVASQNRD